MISLWDLQFLHLPIFREFFKRPEITLAIKINSQANYALQRDFMANLHPLDRQKTVVTKNF